MIKKVLSLLLLLGSYSSYSQENVPSGFFVTKYLSIQGQGKNKFVSWRDDESGIVSNKFHRDMYKIKNWFTAINDLLGMCVDTYIQEKDESRLDGYPDPFEDIQETVEEVYREIYDPRGVRWVILNKITLLNRKWKMTDILEALITVISFFEQNQEKFRVIESRLFYSFFSHKDFFEDYIDFAELRLLRKACNNTLQELIRE